LKKRPRPGKLCAVTHSGNRHIESIVRVRAGKGAAVQSKELMWTDVCRQPACSAGALARAARISAFVCFTAVAAQLAAPLPFTPVPVTMQTLFVVLAGLTLGARDGFYALLAYLAIGFAGAPVFAGFSFGPAALLGPTAGYLVSFPAAALVSGYLFGRLGGSRVAAFFASLCGMALILASGASYLSFVLGLPFAQTASLAILPFIAGDLAKAGLAALLSKRGV
jgi:biotin transport system substrate-specific component